MKLIHKSIIVLLCLATLGFSSCSIDDVKPINQLTDENVIRDKTSAQHVLNGIYSQWRQFNLGYFPLLLSVEGNEAVFNGALTGSKGFDTNDVPVDNPNLTEVYNAYYKIINQTNFFIQKVEDGEATDLGEDRKKEMLAEAKFNRALAYFSLLRNFGEFYDLSSANGVVIRKNFANEVETSARSSVQEVYNFIKEDLDYAVANGPADVAHHFGGNIAATALLAKVNLYTKNYEQAASLANEVINNSQGYELVANYGDIFEERSLSAEVIFAPFAGGNVEGVDMDQVSRTSYSAKLEMIADENTDGPGDLAGAGSGYDQRFLFAYSEATEGPNMNAKYPNNSSAGEKNTNYHLRMAEMYLIYAEAEVRNSSDVNQALDALNTVRARAGVDAKNFTDNEQLLKDIREEKLIELFIENGEGWYDLIRYHELGDVNAFDEKETLIDEHQFILPIPLDVLSGNNMMNQNTGY